MFWPIHAGGRYASTSSLLGQLVEARTGAGAVDQRVVAVDDALRLAGRPRGEEHRRDVVGLRLGDLLGEEAGSRRRVGATRLDQRVERGEAGLAVVAQAARIVEPDPRQTRALVAHLDQLVDLLLVLDDGEGDVGVGDREDELAGGSVLVERHRDRAERLGGEHRGVETRPVLADDDEVLAALQPGFGETARERLDELGERAPLSVCQMPNSFSRSAGASGRAAACSSRRRGKVVCTVRCERRDEAPRRAGAVRRL